MSKEEIVSPEGRNLEVGKGLFARGKTESPRQTSGLPGTLFGGIGLDAIRGLFQIRCESIRRRSRIPRGIGR